MTRSAPLVPIEQARRGVAPRRGRGWPAARRPRRRPPEWPRAARAGRRPRRTGRAARSWSAPAAAAGPAGCRPARAPPGPRTACQVEQPGAGGDRLVGDQRAAQPGQHVVLEPASGDPGEQLRPLLAEPDQLGQRRHRVHRRAGPRGAAPGRRGRAQPVGLRGGPRVGPGHDGVSGSPAASSPISVCIAELNDSAATGPSTSDTTPRRQCPAPRRGSRRVLLGPARVRLGQRVAGRGAASLRPRVVRNRLGARGAEVDPDHDLVAGHGTSMP